MAVSLQSNTLYLQNASLLPEQDSFDNGLSGNGTAATGQRKSTRQRIITQKLNEYAGGDYLKTLTTGAKRREEEKNDSNFSSSGGHGGFGFEGSQEIANNESSLILPCDMIPRQIENYSIQEQGHYNRKKSKRQTEKNHIHQYPGQTGKKSSNTALKRSSKASAKAKAKSKTINSRALNQIQNQKRIGSIDSQTFCPRLNTRNTRKSNQKSIYYGDDDFDENDEENEEDLMEQANNKQKVFEHSNSDLHKGEGQNDQYNCYCGKSDNDDMIGCDKCFRWYHYQCQGLNQKKVALMPESESYYCKKCITEMKKNGKKHPPANPSSSVQQKNQCTQRLDQLQQRQMLMPLHSFESDLDSQNNSTAKHRSAKSNYKQDFRSGMSQKKANDERKKLQKKINKDKNSTNQNFQDSQSLQIPTQRYPLNYSSKTSQKKNKEFRVANREYRSYRPNSKTGELIPQKVSIQPLAPQTKKSSNQKLRMNTNIF